MQYEVETNGRVRQVVVTRVGDGFAVAVDGRTWHVDAARIDAQTLSLVVDTSDDPADTAAAGFARSVEVAIVPDPVTGQLAVRVGTTSVAVALNGRRRWARRDDGAQAGSGPQRVVAPMPGKIVRVLVQPGATVSARQPIIVIEAMKMENELRAARAGRITDVHVREGTLVDAGTLLVVIE